MSNAKDQLINMFNAGIHAVAGYHATIRALSQCQQFQPDQIIAVGKAASGMCAGALATLASPCPTLLVTKYQHSDREMQAHPLVSIIESAHPVPDENSLFAGKELLQCVAALPPNSTLLLLVSGGASSLAEHLPRGTSLLEWQKITKKMLAAGDNIGQINSVRKQTSLIKDGKLLRAFSGKRLKVLAISDVEGDQISTIGSGIGDPKYLNCPVDVELIASNQVARMAVAQKAQSLGFKVLANLENMYADIEQLAPLIACQLKTAAPGIYIWGGEPTVRLPKKPGSGGRNQSLALLLALQIQGIDNISILVAGTDGSDGPTDAAGAIINGDTVTDAALVGEYLQNADAGSYLRQVGDIFITGPTNTNVMDLVIALVE